MMRTSTTTRATLTAALLVAGLGAAAAPAAAAPETAEAISYTATNSETNTVIRTDVGSMAVEDGVFKVKAANGVTVAGTELRFRVDDFVFPIAAEIHDRAATLTPLYDREHAVYQPVALPFENSAPWKSDYDREQAAWSRMTSTIGMGASVGTLVGGLGGAALGCLIGGVAGTVLTGALLTMFGAGPLAGCIAGAAAVGFLGTIAGQVFVTAPAAMLAVGQYFTTINQPSVTPAAK